MVRAFALYTLLRLGLFVGSLGVLLAAGVRGLVAVLGALLISSIASVYVLRRQRDAFSAQLVARRDAKEQERARLRRLLDEPAGHDGSARHDDLARHDDSARHDGPGGHDHPADPDGPTRA